MRGAFLLLISHYAHAPGLLDLLSLLNRPIQVFNLAVYLFLFLLLVTRFGAVSSFDLALACRRFQIDDMFLMISQMISHIFVHLCVNLQIFDRF